MEKSKKHLYLSVLNALVFIAVLIVNSLASIIPLGGLNTGQVSDLYPNLFVPAGFTFSIWGIIYILLAVYIIYSFAFKSHQSDKGITFMDKIGYLFLFSSLGNICWILSWQYRYVSLSLICMLIILISLFFIYKVLNIGRSPVFKKERLMVHLPISIYFGWISVATIANVTALLVNVEWNRFGLSEQFWTVAVIVVATALGLLILFSRNDIAYTVVILWAFWGILSKRLSLNQSDPAQAVIIAVSTAIFLLIMSIIIQIVRKMFFKSTS